MADTDDAARTEHALSYFCDARGDLKEGKKYFRHFPRGYTRSRDVSGYLRSYRGNL